MYRLSATSPQTPGASVLSRATPELRWPESLLSRTIRIEFVIVQPQSTPQGLDPDSDRHLVMIPAWHAPHVSAQPRAKPASRPAPVPEVSVGPQPVDRGLPSTDLDHHVIFFPIRYATYVPHGLPAQSASGPAFGMLPTADGGHVIWAVR